MSNTDKVSERAITALERLDALGVEATRIFLAVDRGRIATDAEELDARAEAGEEMPLYGLIVSLKDLVDRAGEVTTAGSRLLSARKPATTDAAIVTRLEKAGALIFGRTSLTEFAYSGVGLNPHHGTPGCIFDRKLIPGGSSSGAALSVAHGICDAAIGTDTGGSIRIPAAVNGIYGIKPTASSVSREGIHALAESMDSCGPLAREWPDAVRVLEALRDEPLGLDEAGGGAKAGGAGKASDAGSMRLGVPSGILVEDLAPEMKAGWEHTLEALRTAGAELVELDFDWLEEVVPANKLIVSSEAYAQYGRALAQLEDIGDANVLARIRFSETQDEETIAAAYELRRASIARFSEELGAVDGLLAPTLAAGRPTIERAKSHFDEVNASMLRNCSLLNFTDACAISIPVPGKASGDALDGGFALMIAAPNGADAALVSLTGRVIDALG